MTRITLVRHAEQEAPRFEGDADCPLSPRGKLQAEALVPVLAARAPFDVLYASPFLRARETAAPSARELGLEVRQDPGLREFLMSPEGASTPEAYARAWKLARDHFDSAPEGGESVRDFHSRVGESLDRLSAAHEGERLLLVAHGGVVKMAFLHLMRIPLERAMDLSIQIDHAAVFEWSHTEGRSGPVWKLTVANLTGSEEITP